jgi:predicted nuclease of predicted toxin-antitoxin system
MRFLLDQDVYALTARFLIESGHDVVLVSQIGLSQAPDEEILTVAQRENRILVTRDRDYGNLVFVRAMGSGVIYLRILPNTVNAVHNELTRILATYPETDLARAFVVVEPDGHRLRRLPLRDSDLESN